MTSFRCHMPTGLISGCCYRKFDHKQCLSKYMYINFDKRKLQSSFSSINTPNNHNVPVAHPLQNAGMYGKFSVSGGEVSKRTTDFVCQIHLQHNEEVFLYLFVLQGEFKRKLNKKSVVCMG